LAVASRANAEGYSEREREARQRVEALHAKLSFLTVEVDARAGALPGLAVSRNGVRLGRAAWGTPLPVDPGRHVVEARAPGYADWRGTIEIGAEPRKEVIVVPRLAPQAPPAHGNAPSAKGSRGLSDELTPLRIAGIGFGGAALASFGVATYATLRALDKYDDSQSDCEENVCGVEGDRDRVSAQEAAHLATVSAIAGGVFLAAGVTLFVLGSPSDAEPGVKVTALPTGVRLQGRF
jgi:predicted flap endonuclease-1-like 5' DNA nuclease